LKNITELLGTKYPLIQGGMANVATHKLVSAVSNAGGLGLIGAGGNNAEWVRNEIRKCKELTDKPFGVNIMLMSPYACDIAKVVTEEKVKVVTTGAGNPGQFIKEWKEAGIVVIPVIASVALAKRMERAGADAVVAEGMEAGGHIGETTTMALIPQIVDAINIPVIAAGGIADRRQVLAAFALGAKGVQVGTVLLVSEECPIHINYKNLIVEASDISTMITGREKNAPVRVIKNKMARDYVNLAKSVENREELEKMTLGSHRIAVFEGDLDRGSFMAGQCAGMVKEIKPVKQIIEELFKDINIYRNNLEVL
jgi:enoyl-[acyl-carrier protein] reductase II